MLRSPYPARRGENASIIIDPLFSDDIFFKQITVPIMTNKFLLLGEIVKFLSVPVFFSSACNDA